jgi:catechol-2,3-dioxygenase
MIPTIDRIDHIHVFVSDRVRAEEWYSRVLGFQRVPDLEFWAADGGPLTISNADSTVHIALFKGSSQPNRATIAMAVSGESLVHWQAHLQDVLNVPINPVDHDVAWSLYFADPDGNPYEIVSYDREWLSSRFQTHARHD